MTDAALCSNCFCDQGLRLDSLRLGTEDDSACIHCGSTEGAKLTKTLVAELAHRFFVRGTIHRLDFGAAPVVVFNEHQTTTIKPVPWFEPDVRLFEKTLEVGFFHYGPRLWMVGEVEPLKALQEPEDRGTVLKRITIEYPSRTLSKGVVFYRLRQAPRDSPSPAEHDSPPTNFLGSGRLDSIDFPLLYGSQDLQVCVHECRVAVHDEAFIASLAPTRDLKLLDLTHLLEESVTEFESIDTAVHMLFLARKHAYEIIRAIAISVRDAGDDGLIYPSYFSLLRTGATPLRHDLWHLDSKIPSSRCAREGRSDFKLCDLWQTSRAWQCRRPLHRRTKSRFAIKKCKLRSCVPVCQVLLQKNLTVFPCKPVLHNSPHPTL